MSYPYTTRNLTAGETYEQAQHEAIQLLSGIGTEIDGSGKSKITLDDLLSWMDKPEHHAITAAIGAAMRGEADNAMHALRRLAEHLAERYAGNQLCAAEEDGALYEHRRFG